MSQESDKFLIQLALAGNQKAYGELIRRYEGMIFNFIYRMIGDRAETEDIVQETFIKAFKALDSFDEKYAFSTWLYKIATNHCIDVLRKRKLSTFSLDSSIQTEKGNLHRQYSDDSFSPEKALIYREHTTLILQAIESLPPKYKQVINLRHREEKSYEEIAQILKIPIGTVKARIFRAREILKQKLKNYGIP
ncbi:RNA polymerase subunit sigma-24 [candidate division KSB1 bacterium]|nr:MAG: RNA polymerase subunit sigma-24 [candidate division KSB1 bacterium]